MRTEQPLPRVPVVRGRQDLVVERCRGRRVLHLGCVDAGLLEERLRRGELMHQRLAAVAGDLWGLDIDAAGLDALRRHGFTQLVAGDVSDLDRIPAFHGRTFDVIVASEILEHLDNPGAFLDAARRLMADSEAQLIVTVPNAFRLETLLGLLRGVERVHPDHVYWFSYHTVTHLLRRHGFDVAESYMYSFAPPQGDRAAHRRVGGTANASAPGQPVRSDRIRSPVLHRAWGFARSLSRRVLAQALLRRTPFFSDGIIVVARPREEAAGK